MVYIIFLDDFLNYFCGHALHSLQLKSLFYTFIKYIYINQFLFTKPLIFIYF